MIEISPASATAATTSANARACPDPARPRMSQAGLLRRQPRAAADRADDQVRQRHGRIESTVAARLEPRHADRRLRNARGILPARDEHRRKAVRVVSLHADAAAHHAADDATSASSRASAPAVVCSRSSSSAAGQHDLGAHLPAPDAHQRLHRSPSCRPTGCPRRTSAATGLACGPRCTGRSRPRQSSPCSGRTRRRSGTRR